MKKVLDQRDIEQALRHHYGSDDTDVVTLSATRRRGADAPEFSATIESSRPEAPVVKSAPPIPPASVDSGEPGA